MLGSMMRRAMLGDGSTLSLDFTAMSTTADLTAHGLTFTRASTTATYINSSGYVTTAGTNVARFDHDPTTLAPRGLLIEGQATNLLKHSQGLFTSWIQFGTVGALTTGITSPSGDSSAVSLNLNTAGNNGYYTNNAVMGYTNTVGATYTFSVWVRATGSTTNFNIRFGDSAVGYSANIPITTSWQRLQYQYVAVAASGPVIASATGTATGVVELWGAQLEAGSASSYIPTGASQGTRNADSCVMTGTNFSSWFNATEGTLLAHAIRGRTSDIGRIATVNDNTANESIELAADTSGEFIVVDGGSTLANITPGTVTANTAFKIAGAYKLNDVQAALGGTLGTADTSVPTLPTVDRLMIGQQAGASPVYLNGTIALLKYWPTRLPNAQLQSLTT